MKRSPISLTCPESSEAGGDGQGLPGFSRWWPISVVRQVHTGRSWLGRTRRRTLLLVPSMGFVMKTRKYGLILLSTVVLVALAIFQHSRSKLDAKPEPIAANRIRQLQPVHPSPAGPTGAAG